MSPINFITFMARKARRDKVFEHLVDQNLTYFNTTKRLNESQHKAFRIIFNSPLVLCYVDDMDEAHEIFTYAYGGWYQAHKTGWNKNGATVFNIKKEYVKVLGKWCLLDSEDF